MGVELSNCKKTLDFFPVFIYRYMVRRFYSLNFSGCMQYALDSSIPLYIFRSQKQRGRAPKQLPFSEKEEEGEKKKVYGDSFERLGPSGCFRREQKMRRARVMGGSFSPGSLQTTKNLDLFSPNATKEKVKDRTGSSHKYLLVASLSSRMCSPFSPRMEFSASRLFLLIPFLPFFDSSRQFLEHRPSIQKPPPLLLIQWEGSPPADASSNADFEFRIAAMNDTWCTCTATCLTKL